MKSRHHQFCLPACWNEPDLDTIAVSKHQEERDTGSTFTLVSIKTWVIDICLLKPCPSHLTFEYNIKWGWGFFNAKVDKKNYTALRCVQASINQPRTKTKLDQTSIKDQHFMSNILVPDILDLELADAGPELH